MSTILSLLNNHGFGLKAVLPYNNARAVQQRVADPSLILGVELEIENASDTWRTAGMDVTTDGSLRNSGYEFVTKPMTPSVLYYVLKTFFDKARPGEECYSDRTSIHVHTNVQDLTLNELTGVLCLYQVFENQLFRFAGQERDNNIYCVPWSQANYTFNMLRGLKESPWNSSARWAKYMSLNLLPITTQGTIEFRHMPGTADLDKIFTWVNLLGSMFAYARKQSSEEIQSTICNLNTNSAYASFVDQVFTEWADFLKYPGFHDDLEDGVLSVKYMTWPAEVPPTKDNTVAAALDALDRAFGEAGVEVAPPPQNAVAAVDWLANFPPVRQDAQAPRPIKLWNQPPAGREAPQVGANVVNRRMRFDAAGADEVRRQEEEARRQMELQQAAWALRAVAPRRR